MRRAALTMTSLLALLTISSAAQAAVDFSGTWVRNDNGTEVQLVIQQQGSTLTITRGNGTDFTTQTLDLTGRNSAQQTHDRTAYQRAAWDGDTLVVTERIVERGPAPADLHVRQAWSLSADGSTLTIQETGRIGRAGDTTGVYTRQ